MRRAAGREGSGPGPGGGAAPSQPRCV